MRSAPASSNVGGHDAGLYEPARVALLAASLYEDGPLPLCDLCELYRSHQHLGHHHPDGRGLWLESFATGIRPVVFLFIALAQSGIPTGTVFALVATPIIAANWGWEWAFYSFSAVGLVWFVIWQWKVSTSPQSHPTISKDELALMDLPPDHAAICRGAWLQISRHRGGPCGCHDELRG